MGRKTRLEKVVGKRAVYPFIRGLPRSQVRLLDRTGGSAPNGGKEDQELEGRAFRAREDDCALEGAAGTAREKVIDGLQCCVLCVSKFTKGRLVSMGDFLRNRPLKKCSSERIIWCAFVYVCSERLKALL